MLPAGSGFVFRHYHLDETRRRARFAALEATARQAGHVVVLSGTTGDARDWGADGAYGRADRLAPCGELLRLATAHDGDELRAAIGARADAVFLSPVFPTVSHAGTPALGIHGFHVLAQQSPVPVIALGGMTRERARELAWPRWGAIDGLASPNRA